MVTIKEVLSPEQLIRLGEELLINHRDYEQKALHAKYNLTSTDIITGVECPVCFEIGMKWSNRKWVCSNNHISTNAHLQTLEDYFYIFGPEINNTEFRRFFHISSKDVAARMLKKLSLKEIGKGRWRRYRKPLSKQ